jgi:hypothetical protein
VVEGSSGTYRKGILQHRKLLTRNSSEDMTVDNCVCKTFGIDVYVHLNFKTILNFLTLKIVEVPHVPFE